MEAWKHKYSHSKFYKRLATFTKAVKGKDLATLISSCYIQNLYFCYVKGDNLSYTGVLIQLVMQWNTMGLRWTGKKLVV